MHNILSHLRTSEERTKQLSFFQTIRVAATFHFVENLPPQRSAVAYMVEEERFSWRTGGGALLLVNGACNENRKANSNRQRRCFH
jgi:hypothetical protein